MHILYIDTHEKRVLRPDSCSGHQKTAPLLGFVVSALSFTEREGQEPGESRQQHMETGRVWLKEVISLSKARERIDSHSAQRCTQASKNSCWDTSIKNQHIQRQHTFFSSGQNIWTVEEFGKLSNKQECLQVHKYASFYLQGLPIFCTLVNMPVADSLMFGLPFSEIESRILQFYFVFLPHLAVYRDENSQWCWSIQLSHTLNFNLKKNLAFHRQCCSSLFYSQCAIFYRLWFTVCV